MLIPITHGLEGRATCIRLLTRCHRDAAGHRGVQTVTPATAWFKAGISSWLKSSMLCSQLALSSQS